MAVAPEYWQFLFIADVCWIPEMHDPFSYYWQSSSFPAL